MSLIAIAGPLGAAGPFEGGQSGQVVLFESGHQRQRQRDTDDNGAGEAEHVLSKTVPACVAKHRVERERVVLAAVVVIAHDPLRSLIAGRVPTPPGCTSPHHEPKWRGRGP